MCLEVDGADTVLAVSLMSMEANGLRGCSAGAQEEIFWLCGLGTGVHSMLLKQILVVDTAQEFV